MRNQRPDWSTNQWRDWGPTAWFKDHGLGLVHESGLLEPRDEAQLDLGLSLDMLSELKRIIFVNQGWRLTKVGLRLFNNRYQSYRSSHQDNEILTGRIMLGMDSAVGGPWGYSGRDVIVFDQMVHFELQMCDGSAQRFLSFKKIG